MELALPLLLTFLVIFCFTLQQEILKLLWSVIVAGPPEKAGQQWPQPTPLYEVLFPTFEESGVPTNAFVLSAGLANAPAKRDG